MFYRPTTNKTLKSFKGLQKTTPTLTLTSNILYTDFEAIVDTRLLGSLK